MSRNYSIKQFSSKSFSSKSFNSKGFNANNSTPLSFANIFGANYYDDWDFNDLATISETGGLINSITSKGLNGAMFQASGSNRPTLVGIDPIFNKGVADFDGVSEIMEVPDSKGMYDFLISGKGFILVILKLRDTASASWILGNGRVAFRSMNFYMNGGEIRSIINSGSEIISTQSTPSLIVEDDFCFITSILDNPNATPAERNILRLNDGIEYKGNSSSGAVGVGDSDGLLKIGNAFGGSNFFDGKIARILIADDVPTTEQLGQVEELLTLEYGEFPIN